MEDGEGGDNPGSLSARLRARGAKPHSRMSDLSRYILEHYDEIRALVTVDRFAWPDIAALLAEEEGLADDQGRPVSGNAAKLAYSRVGKLRRPGAPTGQPRSVRKTASVPGAEAPPEVRLSPLPPDTSLPRRSEPMDAGSGAPSVIPQLSFLQTNKTDVSATPVFELGSEEPGRREGSPEPQRAFSIPLPKPLTA